MTSIEDQQPTVNALHNQVYALYHRLLEFISPQSSEGQALKSRMETVFSTIQRLRLPDKINQYKLQYNLLNKKMKEIVEATSRNRRSIGDGSASRHGRREVAAGRFLTSNGTKHGQSNAVNSPASSVQNLSASSQLVQQSETEKKKRTNFKTLCDHQIFHGTADPRNSSLRKQAERDHTDQVRNQYLQAYQSLSPDLLTRCIQCPIAISDDSLVREPSLLTHEMCDLHNRFITFAYISELGSY